MDIVTAIIGIAFVVACALPFLWLNSVKKKAEKKLLTSLIDFAAEHNGIISRSEILGNMAIGLDEQANKVFFCKKSGAEETSQKVELAAIKTCEVIKMGRTFNDKEGPRTVIEKLELSFVPTAEKEPTIAIEFYDAHKNVQLNGELQLVEKWANWLNERLKQTKG